MKKTFDISPIIALMNKGNEKLLFGSVEDLTLNAEHTFKKIESNIKREDTMLKDLLTVHYDAFIHPALNGRDTIASNMNFRLPEDVDYDGDEGIKMFLLDLKDTKKEIK